MKMVLRRRVTELMLCALMVFSVTFTLVPSQAQADTVKDVGKQLATVYDQLVLDPNDLNDVAMAKAKLANLSRDPNSAPWPEVFDILLTDQVVTRLSGEDAAKGKIIDFVIDLANVQYSTKPGHLRKNLDSFMVQHTSMITALFGSDVTNDDLYGFLVAARGEIPNVVTNDVSVLIAIARGDYGQINTAMEKWIRDALMKAATGQYSIFMNKLSDIGWSVDKLINAQDLIIAEVDPGRTSQIALMKAVVRSETHFLQDGKERDKFIKLKAGDTMPLNLSIMGFDWAGSVMQWEVDDPSVATVDDSTKTLTGVTKGKTTLRAYINNSDTNWVYQGTVRVTGGGNDGHGPNGEDEDSDDD